MFPDLPSDRRLTDAEQRQLAELERRLAEDDPDLSRVFDPDRPPSDPVPRGALLLAVAVGAALLVVATVVGGFGGAAAMSAALLLTALVVLLPRVLRPLRARRRRRTA